MSPTAMIHQLANHNRTNYDHIIDLEGTFGWNFIGAKFFVSRKLHLQKKFHFCSCSNSWLRVIKKSGITFVVLYLTGPWAGQTITSFYRKAESLDINTNNLPEHILKWLKKQHDPETLKKILGDNITSK